jgi:hypothetical protein
MESFNYLSVLLSIILGLAITQVLLGFRGLILTRMKVKLYLPTVIWAGLALLIAIQAWWASFGLRMRASWTFLGFIVIVLQAISVYMATAVVLPDITGDSIVTGHLPGRLNGEFHVIFALAAIVAAIIRREWVHELLAPVFAVLFLLYITLLFGRL